MEEIDHEAIRERKGICSGCGSPLREVGPIEGDQRGDVFECTKEGYGHVEHRMYGDRYYENDGG